MNKKIVIPAIALAAIVSTSAFSLGQVQAQEASLKFPPMIEALVEKFNLNEDEVVSFISEHRIQQQEARTEEITAKLDSAVSTGKITNEQKNELLAMMKTHQESRLSQQAGNMNREAMREQMQAHREELTTWAAANNINLEDLELGMPRGRGGEFGNNNGTGIGGRKGFTK